MNDNERLIDEARDMATRHWLTAAMQPDVQATLAMLSDALEASDARLSACRTVYEKRCDQTVDGCSDDEDLFLADLRDALDGTAEDALVSEVKALIGEARESLEQVGDGDWTPQDTVLARLCNALEEVGFSISPQVVLGAQPDDASETSAMDIAWRRATHYLSRFGANVFGPNIVRGTWDGLEIAIKEDRYV